MNETHCAYQFLYNHSSPQIPLNTNGIILDLIKVVVGLKKLRSTELDRQTYEHFTN